MVCAFRSFAHSQLPCTTASPALQGVSQDTRPEVRNSGVRTLFAVVVNQGPRLSRALWEQCLWEMLFPLLNHAYLMSATASRDEVRTGMDCWAEEGLQPSLPDNSHFCKAACTPAFWVCPLEDGNYPSRRLSRWCWASPVARRCG